MVEAVLFSKNGLDNGVHFTPRLTVKEKVNQYKVFIERKIQVAACKYVDEIIVCEAEADVLEILKSTGLDVRILGDEYRNKDFTGREEMIDR